jgi:hypothetical protein
MSLEAIQTLHKRFWQWLKTGVVQTVPDEDGLCEFDCRKEQCSETEWENCERRINKAAGELWPGKRSAERGGDENKDKCA